MPSRLSIGGQGYKAAIASLIIAVGEIFPGWAGSEAPLNYFLHAQGPAARPTMVLGWVFTAVVVAACAIVGALLLIAILHKRHPQKSHYIVSGGNGPRWMVIGTAVSTAVLFAMAVYALVILNESAAPPQKPALTIIVTAYDWWWKVSYENADPARRFETANEIHIPTGVPVLVTLESADVIHAFWVPQLAGKTEMIPGITNQQWLQADKPGIYRGQCTQFCGLQHAHMAFEVVAQQPEDFEAWQASQRRVSPMPAGAAAVEGQRIFIKQCAACHTVRGGSADGQHGPDLTHLGSRRLIAGGLLINTPQHVRDWVQHAQELKPGSRMPDISLPKEESDALAHYLSTLQ